MRSKVLVIITAVLLFGVGFAVYAFNSTPSTDTVAASCCCCSGDSCPMKASGEKAAKTEGSHSCSCCASHANKAASPDGKTEAGNSCCGDSCPMKSGSKMEGMAGHKMEPGMKHEMKMGEGHSCPMMNGDKAAEMHKNMKQADPKAADMHKGMNHSADGKAAGCSCACCSHSTEKKVTAAI